MKKSWVCALLVVVAAISGGATALYMEKQYSLREQALLADARQAARPVLAPFWIMNKIRSAFSSSGGGCGVTTSTASAENGADCPRGSASGSQ